MTLTPQAEALLKQMKADGVPGIAGDHSNLLPAIVVTAGVGVKQIRYEA